jgi:hypothetical protein
MSRLAAALFKPLDGGYLFETPNPWIFAPGRRYIVTEAQKAALLGTFSPSPTALRIVLLSVIVIAIACGWVLLWMTISPHKNATAADGLGTGAAFLVVIYMAMLVKVRRYLGRLAPILAAAVPTTAKRSFREQFLASTSTIPTKIVVFCLVLWSVAAVVDAVSLAHDAARPSFGGSGWSLPALNLALAVGLALYHAFILRNRRKQAKA